MTGLIAHEWVAKAGGSENVVDQFVQAFPEADLQVLWSDAPDRYADTEVYETWLARTPLRHNKALALPLLPATWRSLKGRQEYEWILASSHLFAHHVRPRGIRRDIPKLSYVHTPARYIWEPDLDRRGRNLLVRMASEAFKPIDRKRALESTKMAANSEFTRQRIQRVWDRDSDVIYPPVDVERIIVGGDWRSHLSGGELATLEALPDEFVLGASRFVAYKRLDLVINAGEAIGIPVVLAGRGQEYDALKAKSEDAAVPVSFIIGPLDAMLYALYQRASALVFPAVEDFGIMPVEAMATGTPVIAPSVGGAAESVELCAGGATVEDYSRVGWKAAFDQVQHIDRTLLPARTRFLSQDRFRDHITAWVDQR